MSETSLTTSNLSTDQRLWHPLKRLLLTVLWLATFNTYADWQIDGQLSLDSDYVYRGLSLGDGQLSPSAGIQVNHQSGLSLNAWLSRVDIAGLAGRSAPHEWETEIFLSHQLSLSRHWQLVAGYAWQEYIQDQQPRNHDYREWRLNLDYQDWLSFFAAYTDSIWNLGNPATTLAASGRFSLAENLFGELEVGVLDMSGRDIRYPFMRLAIGRAWQQWSGRLTYHYSGGEARDVFNSDRIGQQLVAGISYHF